jgi:hypothetical protein
MSAEPLRSTRAALSSERTDVNKSFAKPSATVQPVEPSSFETSSTTRRAPGSGSSSPPKALGV